MNSVVVARQAATREHLENVLKQTDGNVSAAARLAGMDRSNFRRAMTKAGLRKSVSGRVTNGKTPRQAASHQAVQLGLKVGWLTPMVCEQCGKPQTVAHHDDYLKPLDIRWLCRRCHRAWHSKHAPANP
jgi:ribosomal protein S27AE